MSRENTETSRSLQSWHEGDRKSLDALIERHLPWIRSKVHQQMGPILRSKGETCDYVQDVVTQFLQDGPRFKISNDIHFRALLLKIVLNTIHKKMDWFMARRRAIARERPLPSDTVLSLDPVQGPSRTPSQSVEQHEIEAWLRLGMTFLDPQDQELLILRQWDELSFAEIGERLEISSDAARMRHNRALTRLSEKVWNLRCGKLYLELEEETKEQDS